jgi:hypothetical protein
LRSTNGRQPPRTTSSDRARCLGTDNRRTDDNGNTDGTRVVNPRMLHAARRLFCARGINRGWAQTQRRKAHSRGGVAATAPKRKRAAGRSFIAHCTLHIAHCTLHIEKARRRQPLPRRNASAPQGDPSLHTAHCTLHIEKARRRQPLPRRRYPRCKPRVYVRVSTPRDIATSVIHLREYFLSNCASIPLLYQVGKIHFFLHPQ